MPSSNSNRKKPNRFHGRVETDGQICAIDGCSETGEFRAPSLYGARNSYDGPGEYRWLCLDHVREFNQGYDYFSGMDQEQIFEAQHPVRGWDSSRRIYDGQADAPSWADFVDPLDAIGARFSSNISGAKKYAPPVSNADQKALKTLGLGDDAQRSDIRRAYSALVRKYHPDRNGGDRSHEKQLANVIDAYTQLKESPDFR
ncbi:MAG: J domain-containing protein [Parasphingorhabdus sp.]